MPEELLQRLRDIHYPDAPGWFPPAPGWWILAALIFALLSWGFLQWRKRARNRAPYALALQLLAQARTDQQSGALSAREYLDESNQILKRLLIHIRHNSRAVSASGSDWLLELDRLHDSQNFSQGAGRVLGAERYARNVPTEFAQLDTLLASLVTRLRDHAVDAAA